MPSPAKHVVVAQPPQAQQAPLQIQPSIISQQAVAAAAAAAQQQYAAVPVSMVETGRQMLLTNAVQTSWPGGSRQMAAIVPSWQQLPPQHAAIQQPLLSDAGDWGRPLIVDSSAILQRPVFPVTEVYNTSALVEHPPQAWAKRSVTKHHQHHVTVPQQSQHRHEHKKETQQLSPVKKRVKESTPPSNMRRHSPSSSHWQQQPMQQHHHSSKHSSSHNVEHHQVTSGRQQTITIHDTPSPAVSVITISDSEDETPGKCTQSTPRVVQPMQQTHSSSQSHTNGHATAHSTSQRSQRKNIISCVTVGDSDGEASPGRAHNHLYQHLPQHPQHQQTTQLIKHEPQQQHHVSSSSSGYSSQSQKKRLLAKVQSECNMVNVATKPEPGVEYLAPHPCHAPACKEPPTYQYVTTSSAHPHLQEQHIVYTTGTDKRVSWPGKRAEYKHEYVQPPAAHSRDHQKWAVANTVHQYRQSQVVGSAAHPGHTHSHHGHPAHLSPGGGGGGRSPAGGPVIGSAQHLGQPLYQEYAHVRSRAHAVPPPVYVTAAPSQAPTAIQQQQVPTYQGFTPGRALPPPAHHSSARPLLASHAAHPLPAHMQPTAVYGLAPLSPAKHQYQPSSLWFTE
uniref:Homeodomain interacting protein kinase n=1 Tax=Apis cerana TaxID=7461 RepID=V9IB26_APICE